MSLPIHPVKADENHDDGVSAGIGPAVRKQEGWEQGQQIHDHDLTGIKVLVVDDEPDALFLVEQVLRHSGATVYAAGGPHQALKLFAQEKPDILVSDIGMPDMDGFELIRRIRSMNTGKASAVPAIALTAFARAEDRRRAMEAGFTAYMSKPLEPAELISNIAAFLQPDSLRN